VVDVFAEGVLPSARVPAAGANEAGHGEVSRRTGAADRRRGGRGRDHPDHGSECADGECARASSGWAHDWSARRPAARRSTCTHGIERRRGSAGQRGVTNTDGACVGWGSDCGGCRTPRAGNRVGASDNGAVGDSAAAAGVVGCRSRRRRVAAAVGVRRHAGANHDNSAASASGDARCLARSARASASGAVGRRSVHFSQGATTQCIH